MVDTADLRPDLGWPIGSIFDHGYGALVESGEYEAFTIPGKYGIVDAIGIGHLWFSIADPKLAQTL